jgi:hypothetical protein
MTLRITLFCDTPSTRLASEGGNPLQNSTSNAADGYKGGDHSHNAMHAELAVRAGNAPTVFWRSLWYPTIEDRTTAIRGAAAAAGASPMQRTCAQAAMAQNDCPPTIPSITANDIWN